MQKEAQILLEVALEKAEAEFKIILTLFQHGSSI